MNFSEKNDFLIGRTICLRQANDEGAMNHQRWGPGCACQQNDSNLEYGKEQVSFPKI